MKRARAGCTTRSDPGKLLSTKIAGASERPQSAASVWRSLQVSRRRGCFALLYPCWYLFQWFWAYREDNRWVSSFLFLCLLGGLREEQRQVRCVKCQILKQWAPNHHSSITHTNNAKSAAVSTQALPSLLCSFPFQPSLTVLLRTSDLSGVSVAMPSQLASKQLNGMLWMLGIQETI
ncbi:hypothetical protein B0T20DRAFT_183186 [Sordaria brevicollis]|uniref:Uncharacterized protein n=1 Tax=Sordaria brevicollis TaxID=83679 RepID=A0AAE0PHY8_SORBR|nr:hypothetical protein B0T20DRAFT_183186 [Sordaria brevicollis]